MSRSNNEKYRVMVIDDEPDVAAYLSTVLESNGFEPMTLCDLSDGIRMIAAFDPDLICLDIMMPQETGISFYKKIRQIDNLQKIPVIIISGATPDGEFNFEEYAEGDSIVPPDHFMEKPIVVSDFIKAVNRLIKKVAS